MTRHDDAYHACRADYDLRCQKWIQRRFGETPDLGSVKFSTDCAAYASGGWATIMVEWEVNGQSRDEDLIEDAWKADIGWIIRELLDDTVT